MSGFFKTIWGIIVALARLIVLEFILFFNGLNHILFNKSEIVSVSITIAPQRQEREKCRQHQPQNRLQVVRYNL